MKPAGSHSASFPFKHKPYYKKAKYVSISLDHRLLLTKNTFYSVLLNILECIKIAEIHEKSHSWLAASSAGWGQGGGVWTESWSFAFIFRLRLPWCLGSKYRDPPCSLLLQSEFLFY